jgi:hypothetical protein
MQCSVLWTSCQGIETCPSNPSRALKMQCIQSRRLPFATPLYTADVNHPWRLAKSATNKRVQPSNPSQALRMQYGMKCRPTKPRCQVKEPIRDAPPQAAFQPLQSPKKAVQTHQWRYVRAGKHACGLGMVYRERYTAINWSLSVGLRQRHDLANWTCGRAIHSYLTSQQ